MQCYLMITSMVLNLCKQCPGLKKHVQTVKTEIIKRSRVCSRDFEKLDHYRGYAFPLRLILSIPPKDDRLLARYPWAAYSKRWSMMGKAVGEVCL